MTEKPKVMFLVGPVYTTVSGSGLSKAASVFRFSLGYKTEQTYVHSLRRHVGGQFVGVYDQSNHRFPRGITKHAYELCQENGIDVVLNNGCEVFSKPSGIDCRYNQKKELRNYQIEAVETAVKKRYGIIELPTGSGKTLCMMELHRRLNPCRAVIVTNGASLVTQTAQQFIDAFPDLQVVQWGGGKQQSLDDSRPWLVVSTFQSFDKNQNNVDLEGVELVQIDETHFAAASTFQSAAKNIPSPHARIGWSATSERETNDQYLLKAYMGRTIYKVSQDTISSMGAISKAHVSTLHIDFLRQSEAKELVKGRKALIVTEHIKTTEFLSELFGLDVLHGQTKKREFNERFEQFRTAKEDALVVTSIFDVGIDIPDIDTIIHYGHFDSLPRLIQRNGRAMRPHESKEVRIYHNIGNKKDANSFMRMREHVYLKCPGTYVLED